MKFFIGLFFMLAFVITMHLWVDRHHEKDESERLRKLQSDSLIFRAITPEGARVYQLKPYKTPPCYPIVVVISEDGHSVSISNR